MGVLPVPDAKVSRVDGDGAWTPFTYNICTIIIDIYQGMGGGAPPPGTKNDANFPEL